MFTAVKSSCSIMASGGRVRLRLSHIRWKSCHSNVIWQTLALRSYMGHVLIPLCRHSHQLAHASHIAQQAFNLASGQGNGVSAASGAGASGTEEPRKKRPYKPRDPNAPKRPLTAYFRYLQGGCLLAYHAHRCDLRSSGR